MSPETSGHATGSATGVRRNVRRIALGVLLVIAAPGVAAPQADPAVSSPEAERPAVVAALALVPVAMRRPIVVIDPEGAADPEAVRRLDAFTVREPDGRLRPKIYLNRESAILRQAASGCDFYVKVLAAVIVHEAAHLQGRGEHEARAAEIRFVSDLVNRGLLPTDDGMRYLATLRKQEAAPAPPDSLGEECETAFHCL
jgi:hypothetical protein